MWLLLQALSPVNFIVSPCVWMSQMTHVAAATGSVSGELYSQSMCMMNMCGNVKMASRQIDRYR